MQIYKKHPVFSQREGYNNAVHFSFVTSVKIEEGLSVSSNHYLHTVRLNKELPAVILVCLTLNWEENRSFCTLLQAEINRLGCWSPNNLSSCWKCWTKVTFTTVLHSYILFHIWKLCSTPYCHSKVYVN